MQKWNPCLNDNSKPVYKGERNHLFKFLIKKFKPIEIAFILSICIYDLSQKNRLLTSDIHNLWNGNDFEGVISLKLIHFNKKFVAKKITLVEFLRNESDLAILGRYWPTDNLR